MRRRASLGLACVGLTVLFAALAGARAADDEPLLLRLARPDATGHEDARAAWEALEVPERVALLREGLASPDRALAEVAAAEIGGPYLLLDEIHRREALLRGRFEAAVRGRQHVWGVGGLSPVGATTRGAAGLASPSNRRGCLVARPAVVVGRSRVPAAAPRRSSLDFPEPGARLCDLLVEVAVPGGGGGRALARRAREERTKKSTTISRERRLAAMDARRTLIIAIGTCIVTMAFAGVAHADSYSSESAFLADAGTHEAESFETIAWDSWIYHTRLPGYIPALDTSDDPLDPNDGPDYDLDGHFDVTGNSIAYATSDELFRVYRVDPDGSGPQPHFQYLSFSPYYNGAMWGDDFDAGDTHPIIAFDNFGNSNDAITSFGLTFYNYVPSTDWWITMQFGDEFVQVTLPSTQGSFFFGYVGSTPFSTVRLHTNQNGASIGIDSVVYGTNPVPEPSTVLLVGAGCIGLLIQGRRRITQGPARR